MLKTCERYLIVCEAAYLKCRIYEDRSLKLTEYRYRALAMIYNCNAKEIVNLLREISPVTYWILRAYSILKDNE